MISRGALAVVLACGVTALSSTAGAVGGDSLRTAATPATYRFAWPKGKLGTMTYTHTKPIRGEVQTMSVRYDVNVERDGSGAWTVNFKNAKVIKSPGGDLKGVQDLIAQIQPPITIDSDGNFVGIPPGAAEAVLKSVDALAGKPVVPESARPAVVEMLAGRSKHFWTMLVGRFIGQKVAPESSYPIKRKVDVVPGMPPADVGGTGKTSKARPCGSGASGSTCVEVTEVTTLSAADMAKMVKTLASTLGVDANKFASKLDTNGVSISTVVVTEPATLLPRLLRWERSSEVKFEGQTQKISDVEQWEFSY